MVGSAAIVSVLFCAQQKKVVLLKQRTGPANNATLRRECGGEIWEAVLRYDYDGIGTGIEEGQRLSRLAGHPFTHMACRVVDDVGRVVRVSAQPSMATGMAVGLLDECR